MAQWREFAATNEPNTCKWCGKKLRWQTTMFNPETGKADPIIDAETNTAIQGTRRTWPMYEKPGDYGDGHFCGLRCGYMFGVALADRGTVMVKKGAAR